MNFGRAFLAGVVGGAVMMVTMAMARMVGMTTMNMEMAQGSLRTCSARDGSKRWDAKWRG